MTYTLTQFANDSSPSLADLDQNFNAVGVLTPVPCTVSGTNVLSLQQNQSGQAASFTIAAYENGLQLCAVASASNTSSVTAALGSLAQLPVYKDTVAGPVALTGGEIIGNNSFTLRFEQALNSGNGGWHLITSMISNGNTITPALVRATVGVQVGGTTGPTLTSILSAQATLAYTSIVPNSTQDQSFTVAGLLQSDGLALALPLPASSGIQLQGYFAAGNGTTATVTVRASNTTAGSTITPGTVTVGLKGFRTA